MAATVFPLEEYKYTYPHYKLNVLIVPGSYASQESEVDFLDVPPRSKEKRCAEHSRHADRSTSRRKKPKIKAPALYSIRNEGGARAPPKHVKRTEKINLTSRSEEPKPADVNTMYDWNKRRREILRTDKYSVETQPPPIDKEESLPGMPPAPTGVPSSYATSTTLAPPSIKTSKEDKAPLEAPTLSALTPSLLGLFQRRRSRSKTLSLGYYSALVDEFDQAPDPSLVGSLVSSLRSRWRPRRSVANSKVSSEMFEDPPHLVHMQRLRKRDALYYPSGTGEQWYLAPTDTIPEDEESHHVMNMVFFDTANPQDEKEKDTQSGGCSSTNEEPVSSKEAASSEDQEDEKGQDEEEDGSVEIEVDFC